MPPKKGLPKQLELWSEFVKEVRKQNPNIKYSEALQKAKPLYHKYKKDHGL